MMAQGSDQYGIVLYRDLASPTPEPVAVTWEVFTKFLAAVETSPCTAGPGPAHCIGAKCPYKSHSVDPNDDMCWSPVEIVGNRENNNVRFVTMLVVDLDHMDEATSKAASGCLAPYAHVWHTTHNHRREDEALGIKADDICLRAVVRISRKVHASQWRRFRTAALRVLGFDEAGVEVDPSCKDLSRQYFRPSHPKDITPGFGTSEGKTLDVDEVLAWANANLPEEGALAHGERSPLPTQMAWDLDSDAVSEAIATIANAFPAKRRNELALALGGMLRRAGATEDDARFIVREICRQGGSDDPESRAKTVAHTYRLDPESSEMTGLTRVAEILEADGWDGLDIAKEFGDLLTDARNDAFLRGMPLAPRSASSTIPARVPQPALTAPASSDAEAPASPSVASASAPALVPIDLGELRRKAMYVAAKKAGSEERDSRILAVLIRRVLAGKVLAQPGGVGDVETVRDGAQAGVPRDEALRLVVGALAFGLPAGTPWEAVHEVLRLSLAQMKSELVVEGDRERNWTHFAERAWKRATATRQVQQIEERQQVQARQERIQRAFEAAVNPLPGTLTAASMAQAFPPPPPPPPPPLPSTDDSDEPPPLPEDMVVTPIRPAQGLRVVPRMLEQERFPPDGPAWMDSLIKGQGDIILPAPHNARMFLRNHPSFLGHIRWNEISKQVEVLGGPMQRYSAQGIDNIVAGIQDYLASGLGVTASFADLAKRVVSVARDNPYDPLKDYLSGLRWDGVPRLDSWLRTYCGAYKESPEYLTKVGRRWMIALVARGLNPGCKVDNVLIMIAPPGVGKSTAFSVLGGKHFCDTPISLGDKDSRMMAGQYWICELAELVAFEKTGHKTLKGFFSSATDKFRPPYGASLEDSPRRALFVGTSNEDAIFSDTTGNRKYWPVETKYTKGGTEALERDRDQLLAEAVVAYAAGEPWHFGYEELQLTEEETEKRMIETPIGMKVRAWWYGMGKSERPRAFTTLDVAEIILPDRVIKEGPDGELMSIGRALAKMGFSRRRDSHGAREWRHYPTEELLSAEKIEKRRGPGLFALPGGKDSGQTPPPVPHR